MNRVDTQALKPEPQPAEPGCQHPAAALALAAALYLMQLNRAASQDHFDYRFENYQEDNGRMGVQTQTWLFEKTVKPWLILRGQVVYDAISGNTPIGSPPPSQIKSPFPLPPPLSTSVPTAFLRDNRWAGEFEAALNYGPHHLTPQFSYSSEHDYLSYGAAFNYSLDLNEKKHIAEPGLGPRLGQHPSQRRNLHLHKTAQKHRRPPRRRQPIARPKHRPDLRLHLSQQLRLLERPLPRRAL